MIGEILPKIMGAFFSILPSEVHTKQYLFIQSKPRKSLG